MDTVEEARTWIVHSLFNSDTHFSPSGFDAALTIYRAKLRGSFVASLVNGVREVASFTAPSGRYRYNELIRELVRITGSGRAYWFYVTEPDLCILNWVRECRYDEAVDDTLSHFETEPCGPPQGGPSYLGLLGSSGGWLLLHEHNPDEEFSICFHGPASMCKELSRTLECSGDID